MAKDCCLSKAAARQAGYFEGPVGDDWFHEQGPPCQGWPTLWTRIKEFFK